MGRCKLLRAQCGLVSGHFATLTSGTSEKCRKVGFSVQTNCIKRSFVRSLGIKYTGRLLAELNLIDRQLGVQTLTTSKGESQGL